MTTTTIPDFSLDPAQRTAADSPPGPILIIGGPGTGKTHTLVGRIISLLRNGVSPHNITYLTFSSRGADEVRQLLGSLQATADASRHIFTGTFHAYASNFLRIAGADTLGISPRYTIWARPQATEVILSVIEANADTFQVGQMEISQLLQWHGFCQARAPETPPPPASHLWPELIRLYASEKRRQSTLDLDDLIPTAILALDGNDELRYSWSRTRTRHLLVDEFQDITPSQYRLLNLMTSPQKSITIATDPNQNIYSWRGSDAELLAQFRFTHPTTSVHVLRINHRSTKTITQAAAAITNHHDMTGLQDALQHPIRPEGPQPTLLDFSGETYDMDQFVIDQAKNFHLQGLPYEDMAFIFKLHQTSTRLLTPLSAASIPYTLLGQPNRNAHDPTRHITALLATLLNPHDSISFNLAAASPHGSRIKLPPKTSMEIMTLARHHDIHLIDAAILHLNSTKPGSDLHQSLRFITNAWHNLADLFQDPDTQVADLCRRAQTLFYQAQHHLSVPTHDPSFAKLLILAETTPYPPDSTPSDRLARFMEALTTSNDPDHRSSDNDDPTAHHKGITLATIYAAKGLQWNTVWFIDASDHTLPGQSTPDRPRRYHEQQRLFYVASTRATDRLYYCSAASSTPSHDAVPTRFVDTLGDHLLRRPL